MGLLLCSPFVDMYFHHQENVVTCKIKKMIVLEYYLLEYFIRSAKQSYRKQ